MERNEEFNRLTGNLSELHRRIFDAEHEYPHQICADWFVDALNDILIVTEYKSNLTYEEVEKFYTMGIKILDTKLLNGEAGERLIKCIGELARMKELFERDYLMVL